ncbi:MAG TPA: Scr1 family TA system antitoxin-like transcriptional regulator [Glycomyces sp.]|nr:Scr1 family TA system antitoxin-like transcriptional regulator [Glycomyces sp.]
MSISSFPTECGVSLMARQSLSDWYVRAELMDRMDAHGVPDTEVAERLDYSPQTIANWRKGSGQPTVGDVREFFLHYGDDDEEALLYMQQVVRSKKADLKYMEADPRFNALMLAKGELHYRDIFKWQPQILPGVVQTREFHFEVLHPIEGTTDEVAEFGWAFKERRVEGILGRADEYKMSILIGDGAFSWLYAMTPEGRRVQFDRLRELNSVPGWQIRVMTGPHTFGGNFELFLPNGNATAGPAFVFTEIQDRSWCLEESERIKLYHRLIKPNWLRAIPLEEYLDAERDRLA